MSLKDLSIRKKLNVLVASMLACILLAFAVALTLTYRDLLESRRSIIKNVVESAVSQLEPIISHTPTDKLTDAQKAAVKQLIYNLRFDSDNYLYVYDLQGYNIYHPIISHLEGRDMSKIQDKKGRPITEMMLNGVAQKGEIFWRFYWPRPGSNLPVEKLSFAKRIPGTDWVVGTGTYLDDISSIFWYRSLIYFALALLMTAVAYLISIKIAKSISSPVKRLAQQMDALTSNHPYTTITDTERQDELGSFARALAHFQQQAQENQLLRAANEQARYLETFDPETQLLTRKAMEQELPQLLQGLKPERLLAVIMIKIPLLRDIRTQWGTDYVNSVLTDLTHRIKDSLYSYDLLARYYDDTLVLIRPNAADKREVSGLINSIQTIIMHPSKIEGQELSFQSTVGVSLAPQDATQTLAILSNAEEALSDARRIEMDYLYFDQLQTFAVDERLQLWKDIQQALEDNQFFLVFQPLFDLRTNKLLSAEVLLRWQHPKSGFISPAVFVAFAEQSGLVSRLDNWVIRATLAQLKKWQDSGQELPKLAINLSGLTFVRTDLASVLKEAAVEYQIPLSHLELELTEGVLIDSMEVVQSKIEAIKALGVSISIDDFGTGYSSLSRIRNLPIDKVKIDRSFIEELENSHGDRKIIEGITHMAQGLGFKVVAEGVETLEQLNLLRTMNCDIVQGFLLSRPIPPEELMALLEQQNFVIEVD